MKGKRINSVAADVLGLVLLIGLLGAIVYGWVMNLVALFHMTAFSGQMVMRIVGAVIAPIGIVMGYM